MNSQNSKTKQNQEKISASEELFDEQNSLMIKKNQNSLLKSIEEEEEKQNKSNKSSSQLSQRSTEENDLIQDNKKIENIKIPTEKIISSHQVSEKKRSKIKIKRKYSLNPYRNNQLNTINILFGKKAFQKLGLSKIFKRKNIENKSNSYKVFIGRKNIKFFEEFGFFYIQNKKAVNNIDYLNIPNQNIYFENELFFDYNYYNINDENNVNEINFDVIAGISTNNQRDN